MDKIKYDIVLEIKGIVPFRVSKGDLEKPKAWIVNEKIAEINRQFKADKSTLSEYYTQFLMAGDTESAPPPGTGPWAAAFPCCPSAAGRRNRPAAPPEALKGRFAPGPACPELGAGCTPSAGPRWVECRRQPACPG